MLCWTCGAGDGALPPCAGTGCWRSGAPSLAPLSMSTSLPVAVGVRHLGCKTPFAAACVPSRFTAREMKAMVVGAKVTQEPFCTAIQVKTAGKKQTGERRLAHGHGCCHQASRTRPGWWGGIIIRSRWCISIVQGVIIERIVFRCCGHGEACECVACQGMNIKHRSPWSERQVSPTFPNA